MKRPINTLDPKWNNGHPVRDKDLNQDRLRELEKARIAHLPQTILHLENRIVSLHKQMAKVEELLAEARKEQLDRN